MAAALPSSAIASSAQPLALFASQGDIPNQSDLTFDLAFIPYSLAGSYLTMVASGQRLAVRTVRRSAASYRWQTGPWSDQLLQLAMVSGSSEIPYQIHATASGVTLSAASRTIDVLFVDPQTLLVAAHNCGVKLIAAHSFSWIDARRGDLIRVYDSQSKTYMNFRGEGLQLSLGTGVFESFTARDCILLEEGPDQRIAMGFSVREEQTISPPGDPAQTRRERALEVERWMQGCPPVAEPYRQAARLGWYLFSSLQAGREGELLRTSVYSSKMSMNGVWSWDNCINALALVSAHPSLAWDQILTILDHQRPDGVLPDMLSESEIVFGFNKPPVWGWTIERLLPMTPPGQRRRLIQQCYPKIALFHEWWLHQRDLLGDGLPCYRNGDDSGWDNSAIFASRWPVQSPDLTAWLILNADGLADMAALLDQPRDEARWRTHSTKLLDQFHRRLCAGGKLHYFEITPQGPSQRESTSLLSSIPLLLGPRLDPAVRASLVAALDDPKRFSAPSGPSSEALSSPLYESNGYWRGPVWGISTFLICAGLAECGEFSLARKLATRFCDACSRDGHFRENYDALTGAGQYDSGMTWTAADFLLLATWLHQGTGSPATLATNRGQPKNR